MIRTIFYERLERVVQCETPDAAFWRTLRNRTELLALITPCDLMGARRDETKGVVKYRLSLTPIITDLRTVG